jgi:hypothetical protein
MHSPMVQNCLCDKIFRCSGSFVNVVDWRCVKVVSILVIVLLNASKFRVNVKHITFKIIDRIMIIRELLRS